MSELPERQPSAQQPPQEPPQKSPPEPASGPPQPGDECIHTLGDNLPNGAIYRADRDTDGRPCFTYISAGIERVLGVPPAEVLADAGTLYRLVHADDQPRLAAAEAEAVRELGPFHCVFRSWTRSGELRWIECRSAPHQLEDRLVYEGLLLDVTEQKQAEQRLRDADRRKSEFLAMLSHELRNPLAPIRNGLDLLTLAAERGPDERGPGERGLGERGSCGQGETLALMREQLEHLVRLVDDLLDTSRIMLGKIPLRREPTELAAVLRRAVAMARPELDARGHRLHFDLETIQSVGPLRLDADPVRLTQVFTNLLGNAARYTDPGGDVWLAVSRGQESEVRSQPEGADIAGSLLTPDPCPLTPGFAVVRVRDNGIGIDTEMLPRVFDLFTQGEQSLDRSQGGLGIGLTLVRNLVEMHGGAVCAHSEGRGRGSEFVVRLPLRTASPSPITPSPITPRPTTSGVTDPMPTTDENESTGENASAGAREGGAYRILVVDDTPAAAKMMQLLLTRLGGHEVRLAHDGPEAVEAAEAFRPDLIFLDIGLPNWNGYEVARRLRGRPHFAATLIVALTGYGLEEDRRKSEEAGIDEHLVKPPSMDALQQVLAHPKLTGHQEPNEPSE